MKKRIIECGLMLICMGLIFISSGCGLSDNRSVPQQETINVEVKTSEYIPNIPNMYDSEDTAIFLGINEEEKTVRFQNAQTGKRYTLKYSGITSILDKYEQDISFNQVRTGTMVVVRFYKQTKNLVYIKEATDCIVYKELKDYDIGNLNTTISVHGQLFKFNKNLTVMSKDKEIGIEDIAPVDIISIWGYNDQIYSISVDKGHGYLTFTNDTYFIDGWVEVGEKVIKKISDGMKLVVPEGTYSTKVVKSGSTGNKLLTFERGETINWDLSEIEIVVPKNGKIIFTITPATARVYIDGTEVDTSLPVELEYGIHQITVIASGYDTLSKYMKVGSAIANISIDLEKQDKKNNESESEKTTEEEKTDTKKDTEGLSEASSTYKVYIDKPEGAEVYLDGNYIGIAPVSFPKKQGNVVITLRQSGFQTRSYALEIDDEKKDSTYSFGELEKNE